LFFCAKEMRDWILFGYFAIEMHTELLFSYINFATIIFDDCLFCISFSKTKVVKKTTIVVFLHDRWVRKYHTTFFCRENTQLFHRYTSKNAGNFPYTFYVDSYQLIPFKGKGNSFLLSVKTIHQHHPPSTSINPIPPTSIF
jgi:hypothetical protein